jgi:hypothetical protein
MKDIRPSLASVNMAPISNLWQRDQRYYPHLKPHHFSTTLSLLIREKEGVWSKWLWLSALATASIAAADHKKKITHLSLFYHLTFGLLSKCIPRFR